jgi:DNA-binding NarL/FixJ family response regulator
MPIRILLVDDHALFREGLREILEAEPDFEVIGEAGDQASAIAAAARDTPDLVVLDVEIPGGDAADTVVALARVAPRAQVVVLSMYDDPKTVRRLLGLGVRAYLLKRFTRREILPALRAVSDNPDHTALLISSNTLSQLNGVQPELLSSRELEILTLVAAALSNAQIATRLRIAEGTVKRHLRNIFTKLGAVSRIDAVNKAVDATLIPAPRSR